MSTVNDQLQEAHEQIKLLYRALSAVRNDISELVGEGRVTIERLHTVDGALVRVDYQADIAGLPDPEEWE